MHQSDMHQPQSMPKVRRIVGSRAVQQRVVYTIPGVLHLEATGQFPKRIHISDGRVGWFLDEVILWMQAKVDARAAANGSHERIEITERDRFV